MLSEILTTLGDRMDLEVGSLCLSDEEMVGSLEEANRRADSFTNPVIFSKDVAAMFPSFDHEEVARICKEEFLRSDLEVKVDHLELGLYLAILFQGREVELQELGLEEVVHKRIHPNARRILITTGEVLERGEKTVSKFLLPTRTPMEEEHKIMLSLLT